MKHTAAMSPFVVKCAVPPGWYIIQKRGEEKTGYTMNTQDQTLQ